MSPLLALMRDQCLAAEKAELVADTINSTTFDDWDSIMSRGYGHIFNQRGGPLDADRKANGVIVDPIIPITSSTPTVGQLLLSS